MEPQQIQDDVWVFTSALYQTNCTIIRTQSELFIVDPNWLPHEVEQMKRFSDQIIENRKRYLIFTHSDYDHIVGYGAFLPATVIASESFVENLQKDNDVRLAQHFDQSHYIDRRYPITYPEVDIVISGNGQTLQFENCKLTFYLAPGHTAQGIFIIFEPLGVWVAGDYLSDIEFPLINGTLEEYRSTLAKVDTMLRDHQIHHLISGHGTVENTLNGIYKRRDEALQYIEDLEAHITKGIPFPEARYQARYPFWSGILDWHLENIEHLKLDLALAQSHKDANSAKE